jgi:hypothetical protein
MPGRTAPVGITVGFYGTGKLDIEGGMEQLSDWNDKNLQPEETVRWIFLLTSDEFSDTLEEFAVIAKESDVAYDVITKPGDKIRRAYVDVANAASKVYSVEDPLLQLEQLLKEAPRSVLMVLWDPERNTEMEMVATNFMDAKIPVLDFTAGLIPLEVENDEDEAEAEAEEEEEEEIYSRSELQQMKREELREIAKRLNIPVRRDLGLMIRDILAAQGEPEEAEAEPEPEPVVVEVVETAEAGAVIANELPEVDFLSALDTFGERFSIMLENFTETFMTRLEGVVFNTSPEQPMEVEPEPEPEPEPAPRRRLTRRS